MNTNFKNRFWKTTNIIVIFIFFMNIKILLFHHFYYLIITFAVSLTCTNHYFLNR